MLTTDLAGKGWKHLPLWAAGRGRALSLGEATGAIPFALGLRNATSFAPVFVSYPNSPRCGKLRKKLWAKKGIVKWWPQAESGAGTRLTARKCFINLSHYLKIRRLQVVSSQQMLTIIILFNV